MARPTISEVARIAQVSKSTVSRVLNDSGAYVNAETRAKVLNVIEELNYRPSSLARSLSLQRTQMIGLLIGDISQPFSAEIIRGVDAVATANQCDVFLCNMMHDPSRYARLIHSLIDKRVDGVLVLTSTLPQEFLKELMAHHVPVVALDLSPAATSKASQEGGTIELGWVRLDFGAGIQKAVDHLVALGHRRLGYISSPIYPHIRTSAELQMEAFLQALATHGIDAREVSFAEGDQQVEGGKRALNSFLAESDPPTAILSGDDHAAFGVLWAARDLGMALPDELSVIGIDNLGIAADVSPPLTTVAIPRYELGTTAATMLFRLLDADNETEEVPEEVAEAGATWMAHLETTLVVRASTAAWRDPAPNDPI